MIKSDEFNFLKVKILFNPMQNYYFMISLKSALRALVSINIYIYTPKKN
jgi:hypothetical protein